MCLVDPAEFLGQVWAMRVATSTEPHPAPGPLKKNPVYPESKENHGEGLKFA